MSSFQYRLVIGLVVPLVLSALGVLAKKVSRRTGGWRRSDFYLGRELSLAGVATAVTSILVVLLKPDRNFQGRSDLITLAENFSVVLVGFLLFMLIVSMSQDYENEDHEGDERSRELKLIGFVSNGIGVALLVASVALMAD
jgi:hypothetical protein